MIKCKVQSVKCKVCLSGNSSGEKRAGFSLIELLIVIAIMAVIVGLALPNFIGARERSRDFKRKSELNELKTALRLYYNDYGKYPAWTNGMVIVGCGTSGTSNCPVCTSADFAAGGVDGCTTVYMRKTPVSQAGSLEIRYYQVAGGDDFRLKVPLENASDTDTTKSQAKCPVIAATNPAGTFTYAATEYVVCAD